MGHFHFYLREEEEVIRTALLRGGVATRLN